MAWFEHYEEAAERRDARRQFGDRVKTVTVTPWTASTAQTFVASRPAVTVSAATLSTPDALIVSAADEKSADPVPRALSRLREIAATLRNLGLT